jgi:hypothetical protein
VNEWKLGVIEVANDLQNIDLGIFKKKFTVTLELYEEIWETCRKTFLIQKQLSRTNLTAREQ